MSYTARFTEQWECLAATYVDNGAGSTETNTGSLSLANFQRVVIIIHPVDVNDNLDVDIEEATSTAGAGLKALASGGHDITVATTDTKPSVIELRTDELDVEDGFDCLNVEVTTAGTNNGANEYVVEVWGLCNYMPASTTNLDSVTD